MLGTRRWEVKDKRAEDADYRVDDDDVIHPSPSGMNQKQRGDVNTERAPGYSNAEFGPSQSYTSIFVGQNLGDSFSGAVDVSFIS